MKVLLVYPQFPETFWSFSHVLSFVRRKAAMPPLGLLTVAAMTPENWVLKLRDTNLANLSDSDILWADMVFISAMLVQRPHAEELIRQVQLIGKPVVAGGPLFTSQPEEFEYVDHLILGEAEDIFPDFLADLENGQPKPVYKAENTPDIKTTPPPRWDLIDRPKDYHSMPVQFSRGCPFDCEFCDITILFGNVPRAKSTSQMMNELISLYETGWRGSVFMVDDNFIGPKKSTKAFLREFGIWSESNNFPFTLFTEASVNLADDPELMNLMTGAGFDCVFLGLETPAEDSLAECGKKQNQQRDLVKAVQIIQRHGLAVQGGFIVGFDSDPHDIFERQIEFIQESGVVTAMVGLLSALPGTKLYHRLKKEGRLINTSSGNNTDTGSLNFVPIMDKDKLISGYKSLLNTLYEPGVYYERVRIFLRNYQPKRKSKLTMIDMYALCMAVWHLGLHESPRAALSFWRLLLTTTIRRPSLFSDAVIHAVYGLHFRRVLTEM